MPWELINEAIDTNFNYNVSDKAKATWIATTDRTWNNTEDVSSKSIQCPMCETDLSIPWTTCGAGEDDKASVTSLVGEGYGDGELNFTCHGCACVLDKRFLSVARFCSDSRDLLSSGVPMPGTVLRPATGKPEVWDVLPSRGKTSVTDNPLTLPNRLIKSILRTKVEQLLRPSDRASHTPPTMEDVRSMIEQALKDRDTLRLLVNSDHHAKGTELPPMSSYAVRNMMNKYWDNFSPFTLDLCGAVMRQGVFVSKMYRLDWLHSPAAPRTMERIYVKYTRFLRMMRLNQTKMFVPTLDIDLAWHTHQLSPSSYYKACTLGNARFIDHDDKVREDKLGEAFEFTSKSYQSIYGEVYSECTCWYCEAIRTSHVSSVGRVLKMSHNEKSESCIQSES